MLLCGLHAPSAKAVLVVIGKMACHSLRVLEVVFNIGALVLMFYLLYTVFTLRPNPHPTTEARLNDLWESNQAMQSQLNRIEQNIARQQAASPTVRQREIAKRFEKFSKQR